MNSKAPVTLQEIADRAGVSRTTVSLALRNHPKISEETREAVKRVSEALGYRPNPLVSAHMAYMRMLKPRYTGQSVAFVCNRSLRDMRADKRTPLPLYYEGALQRAEEMGYTLQYFNLNDRGMTDRRISQILVARGIQGVIIAPLSEGGGVSNVELQWGSFALAMIEHTFLEPRLHKVCNDEFSTIGRMIQRLLDYGYERIGIAMHSRMDDHANHFWLAGYQAYQALTDERHRLPHFITTNWNKTDFLKWHRVNRPEAIITIDDDILGWLREAGLRVPQDVGCATLYWQSERVRFSGYYQSHELMAAAAVDHVIGQINRNERGLPESEKTTLIQAEWREGQTLQRRTPPDYRAPLRVWTR